MTIQRTREIYKDKMKDWTDEQVSSFISQMSGVVDALMVDGFQSLTKELKHDKN